MHVDVTSPSTLTQKESSSMHGSLFWGKAREKTLYEISGGKSVLSIGYGDDRFEATKWCKYLKGEENEYEMEDGSCEGDCKMSNSSIFEKCPIYCKLKRKEVENDETEISKMDLWHFSEFFHGDLRHINRCAPQKIVQISDA